MDVRPKQLHYDLILKHFGRPDNVLDFDKPINVPNASIDTQEFVLNGSG